MFDWNDEELANIIWGEAGESDDHIVPYADQNEEKPPVIFGESTKKDRNQQTSTIGTAEQKISTIKAEHGVELDTSTKYDTGQPATEFGPDLWSGGPDPSSSNVANSVGTTAPKNIRKGSENGSLTEETSLFDKDSEIFENPPEDGDQGDLDDYGWANIGSFDDLDRIFSNQDPMYGDMSAGHADELWSPSKDVTSSPLGPTPLSEDSSDLPLGVLRTSIDRSDMKAQYMLDPGQPFPSGYEKLNEITSHAPQDIPGSLDIVEHSGGKSILIGKEKTPMMGGKSQACKQQNVGPAAAPNEFPGKLFSCVQVSRKKRLQKGQKLDKKSEVRELHDLSGIWTPPESNTLQQVNSQYAPSMINPGPPLVLTHQSPLQRPEFLQQKNFPYAPLGSPLYANMANHYPATVLPQFHLGQGNHELISSGFEAPPSSSISLKNTKEVAVKPPAMTPREKIEKLRRRQQMRAIIAIQKQQLQFGNQVSVSEHSDMEGGKIEANEGLGSFPSLEPNSPLEQYDSNTISMTFDNCSVEESVLYRLQDTIAKLDVRIRLCIRESLFRLAQSSAQRQYPQDTSSASTSSRDEVLSNKDILGHERFTRTADVETDTNPIDRTVAHLLFNRPPEFTGKPAETPVSPLSANLPYEKKANSLKSLSKGYFEESFENPHITSPQGSKSAGIFSEGNQSENASQIENTDGVETKLETSK